MSPDRKTASRRVRIKDVAEAAGVSTATVSYVLSGKRTVTAPTRERVIEAIESLGYRRNTSAMALRTGRSRNVALIVPDVTNPFYTEVLVGAEEKAAQLGLSVVLRNSNLDAERERGYLRDALASDFAAVLCTPFTPDLLAAGSTGPRASTPPLVLLDEPVAGAAAACVSVDNVRGGELVAEHLAACGRRRAGAIGAPEGMPTSVQRIAGFRRRAGELGLEVADTAVGTAVRRTADAVDQALGIIGADPTIDAFFAGDDLLAIHLVRALIGRGLRVPEDVAVCGFDDISWAALSSPPLTTVRQPSREIGARAMAMVPRLLAGEQVDDVVLPVELVVRETTGPRG